MRELKFRAFDAVLGMRPVIDIDGRCRWWKVRAGGHVYRLSEGALMQYTGLNDANGVEIYEGDIVEMLDGKHSVEWNDDACIWQFSDGSPINGLNEYGSTYGAWKVVIGNIYENPELMEAK